MTTLAADLHGARRLYDGIFLPFLYCTPTILRKYSTESYYPSRIYDVGGKTSKERSTYRPRPQNIGHDVARTDRSRTDFDLDRPARTFRRGDTWSISNRFRVRPDHRDDDDDANIARNERQRHEIRRRSNDRLVDQQYVPFENSSTSPADAAADEAFKDTTITPSERKVFKALFELSGKSHDGGGTPDNTPDTDSPLKSPPADPLDAILSLAASNIRRQPSRDDLKGTRRETASPPKLPDALRPMAEAAREARKQRLPRETALPRKPDMQSATYTAAGREVQEVRTLLEKTSSDVELWSIMHEKVFSRVAALGLDDASSPDLQRESPEGKTGEEQLRFASVKDGESQPAKSASSRSKAMDGSELELLSSTAPTHLNSAFQILTSRFPTSPLPLSILSTLKRLGPSAFAVCTDTALYNKHMDLLYKRYMDVGGVLDLLAEMHETVYEFTGGTLSILLRIEGDAKKIMRGRKGLAIKSIWHTDRMQRDLARVAEWIKRIMQQREETALRDARASGQTERSGDVEEEMA